jgi:hypothetical protein
MTRSFAENLAALPPADQLAGIEVVGPDGNLSIIENKPGSQGSLRLYQHLLAKFGVLDAVAAAEGLALYAEHVEDARLNPGKHPNIDRLLDIAANGWAVSARLLMN